jgi:hypothetical protein
MTLGQETSLANRSAFVVAAGVLAVSLPWSAMGAESPVDFSRSFLP